MQIGNNGYEEGKDKEALFTLFIISTDSISAWAILQPNKYHIHLQILICVIFSRI